MPDSPLIPKPSFDTSPAGEPAHDARFIAEKLGEAAAVVVALAAIARFAPHPVARGVGIGLLGYEERSTALTAGRVLVPGELHALNFGPSPLGYVDSRVFGLEKNFYLPATSSRLIPRQLDAIGFGLPEQRAADARRQEQIIAGQDRRIAGIVAGATNLELQAIIESGLPFGQRARFAAGREVRPDALVDAARVELVNRRATDPTQLTPLVAGLANSVGAFNAETASFLQEVAGIGRELDEEEIRINPFLRLSGGSGLDLESLPVNNLQAEAAKNSGPPMKFVQAARTDP